MTEKFTFFSHSKSPFSQWYDKAPFKKYDITFKTAENFMMFKKGVLFDAPEDLLVEIINASPREAKALGRKIPNFNEDIWNKVAKLIVAEGNYAKFSQNRGIFETLMSTYGTTLVEASPWDKIWGIGLSEDNILAQNRETWLGTNWLGEVLTDVRETFVTTLYGDYTADHTIS